MKVLQYVFLLVFASTAVVGRLDDDLGKVSPPGSIPRGWTATIEDKGNSVSFKLWNQLRREFPSHQLVTTQTLPGASSTSFIKYRQRSNSSSAGTLLSSRPPRGNGGSFEAGITSLFQRARAKAPCLLILEDLGSLVDTKARAFLLNELNGFQNDNGVLIIGTTNHPEELDGALLNRPSRFDQKFTFDLPVVDMRQKFILKWLKERDEWAGITDIDSLDLKLAERTEGWSFAFLKELFISYLLKLASKTVTTAVSSEDVNPLQTGGSPEQVHFDLAQVKASVSIMLEHLDELSVQVKKINETAKADAPSQRASRLLDNNRLNPQQAPDSQNPRRSTSARLELSVHTSPSASTMSLFEELPLEILLPILLQLNYMALHTLRNTCWSFRILLAMNSVFDELMFRRSFDPAAIKALLQDYAAAKFPGAMPPHGSLWLRAERLNVPRAAFPIKIHPALQSFRWTFSGNGDNSSTAARWYTENATDPPVDNLQITAGSHLFETKRQKGLSTVQVGTVLKYLRDFFTDLAWEEQQLRRITGRRHTAKIETSWLIPTAYVQGKSGDVTLGLDFDPTWELRMEQFFSARRF
ncbi:hypothetical protein V8E36_000158 [Tilletia maclaganii]